jgi:hypothetical protein
MLFGQTLMAEAVLVCAGFALGAVLTTAVLIELVGSVGIAACAVVLEVLAAPREYGYPKVLVYALAFFVYGRYLKRATNTRLVALAATVVVAVLFRHDHGLLVGIGAATAVMLKPTADDFTSRVRRLSFLALATLALVSPYLLFVQLNGGIGSYLQNTVDFSQNNEWSTWPRIIGDIQPLQSALFYELYALPLAAVVVLYLSRGLNGSDRQVAAIGSIVAVALPMNATFIRAPLSARLPDAIVPAVVLGAWLLCRAIGTRRRRGLALSAAAAGTVLFSASVFDVGSSGLGRPIASLVTGWRNVPAEIRDISAELHAGPERQIPSRAGRALVPFYRYLERCTSADDRLVLAGFLPDVSFFAKRPFAAGQMYLASFPANPKADGVALARLQRQRATFALANSDSKALFEGRFPKVADYVRHRYVPLTSVRAADNLEVQILVNSSAQPVATDPETGWPCFLPSAADTAVTP